VPSQCSKSNMCDIRSRKCALCNETNLKCRLPQTCQDGECASPPIMEVEEEPPTGFTYLASSNCKGTGFPVDLGEFTSTESCFDACAEVNCQYFVFYDTQQEKWFNTDTGVPARCEIIHVNTETCNDSPHTYFFDEGTAKFFRNDGYTAPVPEPVVTCPSGQTLNTVG
jgi:hypothetical protein